MTSGRSVGPRSPSRVNQDPAPGKAGPTISATGPKRFEGPPVRGGRFSLPSSRVTARLASDTAIHSASFSRVPPGSGEKGLSKKQRGGNSVKFDFGGGLWSRGGLSGTPKKWEKNGAIHPGSWVGTTLVGGEMGTSVLGPAWGPMRKTKIFLFFFFLMRPKRRMAGKTRKERLAGHQGPVTTKGAGGPCHHFRRFAANGGKTDWKGLSVDPRTDCGKGSPVVFGQGKRMEAVRGPRAGGGRGKKVVKYSGEVQVVFRGGGKSPRGGARNGFLMALFRNPLVRTINKIQSGWGAGPEAFLREFPRRGWGLPKGSRARGMLQQKRGEKAPGRGVVLQGFSGAERWPWLVKKMNQTRKKNSNVKKAPRRILADWGRQWFHRGRGPFSKARGKSYYYLLSGKEDEINMGAWHLHCLWAIKIP